VVNTESSQTSHLAYVLITPARNEEAFIEQTIKSVVSQTILPFKWVIVSDGSTDATDDIVKKYTVDHQWIELVRMPERGERHFAGKVHAFNAGYAKVRDLNYDIIGNLDADISFDNDYFEFLLTKVEQNPKLGVAGTPFIEDSATPYNYRFTSIEHVSGACQLFRRECFEAIGGYKPFRRGGIDLVAVITARMKGWQTRTFTEKTCFHHRKMGSAIQKDLVAIFRGGKGDYVMGVDPVWELFRTFYQMTRRPLVLGGLYRLAGFVWAMATRMEILVPDELAEFRKKEQRKRLLEFFTNFVLRQSANAQNRDHIDSGSANK